MDRCPQRTAQFRSCLEILIIFFLCCFVLTVLGWSLFSSRRAGLARGRHAATATVYLFDFISRLFWFSSFSIIQWHYFCEMCSGRRCHHRWPPRIPQPNRERCAGVIYKTEARKIRPFFSVLGGRLLSSQARPGHGHKVRWSIALAARCRYLVYNNF